MTDSSLNASAEFDPDQAFDEERWLDEFESQWLVFNSSPDGSIPMPDVAACLNDMFDQESTLAKDAKSQVLLELVRIDMEYRFRGRPSSGPLSKGPSTDGTAPDNSWIKTIEQYRDQFPELKCTCEWIADEWRLRRQRGETLDPQDWRDRFRVTDFTSQAEYELFIGLHFSQDTPATNDPVDPIATGQSTQMGIDGGTKIHLEPRPQVDVASIDTWASLRERFHQKRMLGQGSFGTVWHALDTQLQRHVAIKTLRTSLVGDAEQRDNLIREARIAATLDHADLLTIHDIVIDEHQVHVVMQWIDGVTLDEWFDGKCESGRDAPVYVELAQIMARIATAVHHAHLAGLIHCDLKPQNVLVDSSGNPTVLDFGLAVRRADQDSMGGHIVGTPAYMSPEQTFGETHHLDGRADIWSLGAILFRLVTGRLPFEAGGIHQIFEAIQTRSLTPMGQLQDDVPDAIERICKRCLAKRIEDRYATAAELAEHLTRFADQRTSVTRLIAPTGKVAGLPWTQPDLIGRDKVIEQTAESLRANDGTERLITLTGGGGVGKTQTAAAIARRIAGRAEQDVIWVELAHATRADQLAAAVSAALGIRQDTNATASERLIDALAVGRPMVLVLDNAEQIVSETADQVARWLARSETLRVLVTSQTPLRIAGEVTCVLSPLSLDSDGIGPGTSRSSDALSLLVRRARQARPDFQIDDSNRNKAIEICRLVDGNPLAIELAAARLSVMSLGELHSRLLNSFSVLKSNRMDQPERHRTLHDVVAWSYEWLAPDARQAFLSLAIWPAPMRSGVAEALLDQLGLSGLDWMDDLASRHLIRIREMEGRMMVQTTAAIHRFATETIPPSQSTDAAIALISVVTDEDRSQPEPDDSASHHVASNLFAASTWLEEAGGNTDVRLSAVLAADRLAGDHWDSRIRVERLTPMLRLATGVDQLTLGLRLADAQRLAGKTQSALKLCDRIVQGIAALDPEKRSSGPEVDELMVAAGRLRARLQYRLGQLSNAIATLEHLLPDDDSVIIQQDPFEEPMSATLLAERMDALLELVEIQRRAGHLDVARSQLQRARRWIASNPDLNPREVRCQIQMGKIAVQTGRVEDALATLHAAVEGASETRDHRDLQQALLGRAAAHAESGDFESAERDYDRSETISRQLGDLPTLAQALNNRALAQDDSGDSSACCETLERALEIYRQLDDSIGIAIAMSAKAAALLQLNRASEAQAILESAAVQDAIPPDSLHHAIVLGDLGASLARQGELAAAQQHLRASLGQLDQLGVTDSAERLIVSIELVGVLVALDHPDLTSIRDGVTELVARWPRQRRDRRRVSVAIETFESLSE
ncbi:MAG: protein kinase [Planctomycetota bacterium]